MSSTLLRVWAPFPVGGESMGSSSLDFLCVCFWVCFKGHHSELTFSISDLPPVLTGRAHIWLTVTITQVWGQHSKMAAGRAVVLILFCGHLWLAAIRLVHAYSSGSSRLSLLSR